MKWNNENVVRYLSGRLNKPSLEFLKMQILNCGKKPNGRRYNSDQKNLALAMYKQSAKAYRFMQRIFIMPSNTTIGTHSAQLFIQPGIDLKLMDFIADKVKDFSEMDKYCVLIWDEVSLKPHIDYSPSRDIIEGFVDVEMRHPLFATHALTYMVRGIKIPFKQPVAFYYTENLNGATLSELIRNVTVAVMKTGNQVKCKSKKQVAVA